MRGTPRIAWALLIRGVVVLLLAYGLCDSSLHAQDKGHDESVGQRTEAELKEQTDRDGRKIREKGDRWEATRAQPDGASEGFYHAIVEYNLFRPLGWRKPSREPKYALIGTLIESSGQIAKAFLLERRSNQYYSVAVGERVGDATVEGIRPSEVSLNKDGETVTLRSDSNQFLDASGSSDRRRKPSSEGSEHASPDKKGEDEKIEGRGDRGRTEDKMGGTRDRFRNASPEERKRMIEEFRRRGGGRRFRGDGGRRRGGDRGGGGSRGRSYFGQQN